MTSYKPINMNATIFQLDIKKKTNEFQIWNKMAKFCTMYSGFQGK